MLNNLVGMLLEGMPIQPLPFNQNEKADTLLSV